jgi:hypothetical protein
MKKFISITLIFLMLLSLFGCNSNITPASTEDNTSTTLPETQDTTVPDGPEQNDPDPITYENLISVSMPSVAEPGTAEDGTHIFTYVFQSIQLSVPDPEVADKVIYDFRNKIEQTSTDAQAVFSTALEDHNSGKNASYLYEILYTPTRIDQGVLSLFGKITVIDGSPNSGQFSISANYDLVTGDVLTLGSILYHADKKEDLCQLVVDHLKERTDVELFDEFEDYVRERFSKDESKEEDFYFDSTGLCFYFSPYEIGPRSSGVIVACVPYENLIGIILDDYFPSEKQDTKANVSIINFDNADLEKYDQYAEAIFGFNNMYIINVDTPIFDIQVMQHVNGEQMMLFAANCLTDRDAILLQTDENPSSAEILFSYRSGGATFQYRIVLDASGNLALEEVQ